MARFGFNASLVALPQAAQTQLQTDPQAVSFASQEINGLITGSTINNVSLTGNVTCSRGATPQTGTVALPASGSSESRLNISLL